ncbi:ribonuclease inhibitor-like [Eleutherodactylus coqui]|uniref:ribonuclease inhibitor-like n=1 Tax=Eleutherodactylus coqui TaxID=57060 RepID=UPI003462A14A
MLVAARDIFSPYSPCTDFILTVCGHVTLISSSSYSLAGTHLSDTSCTQLASGIRNNQSLKILDLSNNRLYGPQFSDLMDALSNPPCGIEKLNLGYNYLPDTACTQLASGIRNNQSLKILDLTGSHLSGPHFSDLMDALSSPACRIEKLKLTGNNLPDTSCTQLASGIRNNQSLKTLDLSGNHLSGPHFSDLMDALSSPACRIEELQLMGNNLAGTSCTQLASGIRNSQSLKILDLSLNHLSGPHFSDLMAALSSPACRIEKLNLLSCRLSNNEKKKLSELSTHKPKMKISN